MFFLTFFRARGFAIALDLLLHRHLTPLGALAGARVGVSPLAADGQVAPVTKAAIAAEIHQSLDLRLDFAAEVTLDLAVRLDHTADGAELLLVEIVGADRLTHAGLVEDRSSGGVADAVDVRQRDDDALVSR